MAELQRSRGLFLRYILTLFMSFTLLATAGCATVGHHEVGIDNFDQVSPALFRGGQPTQQGIKTLAEYHVKTVINLRGDGDSQEAQWVRDAGMTYLHLPLDAETVTPQDAERFLELLAQAPAPVFVHCHVGRDRTGMAVAAYRLREQGWTQQEAVNDLIDHGHFWLLFPKVRGTIAALAGKTVTGSSHLTTDGNVVEPISAPN